MYQAVDREYINIGEWQKTKKYPQLQINLGKIYENTKYTVDLCSSHGISVAGVVKGFNALPRVVEQFINAGCEYIATSRMDQIINLKNAGIDKQNMLLRIPMFSEIRELVEYVDISLNSEIETIRHIEEECSRRNKAHKIILMADLGDLREGIFDEEEFIKTAVYIEKEFKYVKLYGVGTNLGCYGSIRPTEFNLGKLCEMAEIIENNINRKLDIISGGATSSLTLLMDGKMPNRINNLRIGEGILLGRDLEDFWGYDMSKFHKDTFVLKAQIVEIKNKPSYPIGEFVIDAFGNKPTYEDRGMRKRALLAVGKQDFAFADSLIPETDGVEIIGSSSDHLIIDIGNCRENLKVGDILSFQMYYPIMLYTTGASGISTVYI